VNCFERLTNRDALFGDHLRALELCADNGGITFAAEVAGVTFSDSNSAPVPKFLNTDPDPEIFLKFENPTPVQTPATVDPTGNLSVFTYERNTQTPATAEIEKSDTGSIFSRNIDSGSGYQ